MKSFYNIFNNDNGFGPDNDCVNNSVVQLNQDPKIEIASRPVTDLAREEMTSVLNPHSRR